MTGGSQPRAASGAQRFRIGIWTVDPELHQLSAEGRTVKVEPKAMDVLVCLAGRPGQVVTREALLSTIWPGVVVGDDALTQVIVKLRKALGDVRAEPTYIQTIAKGGYLLVAPVVRAGATAPAESSVDAASAPAKRRARWAQAAVVLLLLGAAAAWWFLSDRGSGGTRGRVTEAIVRAAGAALPTVAIRPFEALGGDPREVLLARGITADLVTDLSKVAGLWVISLEAASGPRHGEVPNQAPAVRYLVSGTVQRLDDRLRLQVQLTDAETGRQLWTERFDRAPADLFAIQVELGSKILDLLPVKLGEAETRRVARRYTQNLEAYETFQRGRAALHVRRRVENDLAREMFRRAVALDAGFARAYAGLAMTYVAEYRNQWSEDRAAALDRAFDFARTAHQIDPDIPETYWALAFVHVHRQQHDRALAYLEEALRRYPSYADAYAIMGGIYTSTGRTADAVPLLRTAVRLAPESGYLYLMLLGRAYLFLGDLEQARVNLQHALSRNPEFIDARVYMAAVELAAGDRAAAAWQAEEIRALQPGFTVRGWLETNPTADPALRQRLISALGELGF